MSYLIYKYNSIEKAYFLGIKQYGYIYKDIKKKI